MPLRTRGSRALIVPLAVVLAATACTAAEPDPVEPAVVQTSDPGSALTVIAEASAGDASIATSRALFERAPLVVIAASGDAEGQELSARAAIELGVPLLVAPAVGASPGAVAASDAATPPPPTEAPTEAPSASPTASPGASPGAAGPAPTLSAELERLEATTALVVGSVAPLDEERDDAPVAVERVEATPGAIADAAGVAVGAATATDALGFAAGIAGFERGTEDAPASGASVAAPEPAEPLTDTIALAVDGVEQLASIATARAAGVPVHLVPESSTNPQSSASVIDALHASTTTQTLAIGAAFGAEPALDWKVRAARTGFQLPGGGQLLFPEHQFVALYGTPSTSALGLLGEQDTAATVQRARDMAAPFEALTDRTVVPMFEIIATVAAGGAGADGDYSNELPVEDLRPLVEAAADAGIWVVLDLQPGRSDFLTQAQRYRSLLELPNVGLALDPEWRLGPDEVHLRQIGSVSAAEVNSVVTWLADLTNELSLPQKLFVLHQFRHDMITDRTSLDLSRPELAVLIHVDGLGSQAAKQETWAALQRDAPDGLHWGWKNFIDEDLPMLTPEQTMTEVSPAPDLITYQ